MPGPACAQLPAPESKEAGLGPDIAVAAAASAVLSEPAPRSNSTEYPHKSLVFTVADVVFFSYFDGTMLELYDSSDMLVWNNGGAPLDKGGHAVVNVPQGVYRAQGSEKFAVLTGDPVSLYVVGYYAMDQDGYGASKELYTWVPQLYGHCKFIVFAYEDNTEVTVEDIDTGVDIATVTLNKGEHWDIESLDRQWIHVTADKSVSALTCYDQGYFVPSATGRWSGTTFYTYVSDIAGWPQDLTVIAYNDATSVTITDTTTGIIEWSGTLNEGEARVQSYPSGADKFFTITSSDTVTVSVQPWVSMTSSYHQGAYVQDKTGAGIGNDLVGSTLDGGFLYVMAYKDITNIDIYDSQTGILQASYTLNQGEHVQANPGNGLWRIRSDRPVSAYSGYGMANADFAPVEFGDIINPLNLSKDDGLEDDDCIVAGTTISYDICFDNTLNTFDVHGVTVIDDLPAELIFVSASDGGVYDPVSHTVTWDIGMLEAGATQRCLQLTVLVHASTPPESVITNCSTIDSEETNPSTACIETEVCPTIPVSVDIKPGSCPNSFNVKSNGVLPVAVLGAIDFDVTTIDPGTIRLTREPVDCFVQPIRWSCEDVATPFEGELCDCHDLNGDGYMDLTLKFDTQELVNCLALEEVAGETIPLTLTGNLKEEDGGTPITGDDCLRVLNPGGGKK